MEYTAELNRYRRVWYDPKAITNILSLSHTTRRYRVVFNSKDGNCFRMMFMGMEVLFDVSTNGLYYHDTIYRAIVLPVGSTRGPRQRVVPWVLWGTCWSRTLPTW